jgi:uncharacterized protein YutE (UPF0331/DUF86 family)
MVDPDIIARRILSLNEAIQHLTERAPPDASHMTRDPILKAAVERWLQVSIEACIDIAYHIISEEGWTPPDSARCAFESLASHNIIDPALAGRLSNAAAMRNILVHEYVSVDLELLASTAVRGLDDLRQFGAAAAALIDDKKAT